MATAFWSSAGKSAMSAGTQLASPISTSVWAMGMRV
jgi:hypothetical protein